MKDTTKRYITSTAVTFLTGFCLYFITEIDNISLETLLNGSFMGVIFAGVRAGFKALIEAFLRWQGKL